MPGSPGQREAIRGGREPPARPGSCREVHDPPAYLLIRSLWPLARAGGDGGRRAGRAVLAALLGLLFGTFLGLTLLLFGGIGWAIWAPLGGGAPIPPAPAGHGLTMSRPVVSTRCMSTRMPCSAKYSSTACWLPAQYP